jgi:hypothetical protein
MKKTLIVLSSLAVVIGVFAGPSFAHGGGKHEGFHGWHGHHSSRHGKIWTAKLTPPTAPTANVAHHGGRGSTGSTGATESTGPVGKVIYAQNKTKYAAGVKVKGLSPSTKYDVTIYNGTTALDPPKFDSITTDANGYGLTVTKGLRDATFAGLDKKVTYTVKVTTEGGDVVLVGDLSKKWGKYRGICERSAGQARSHSRH